MTQQLPPKKEVALALLERSNVDVYLDPRAAGVVVPPQFRKEPRLILKIGLNMPVPIPDLRVDEESMSCTLSFSRTPFYCVVPWSAVFAMVGDDGRGMVWPDDVPQELAVRAAGPESTKPREAPALAAVPPPNDPPSSRRGEGKKKSASRTGEKRAIGEVGEPGQPTGPRAVSDGRPKRPRKKKEAPRPVLVSVPQPKASPVAPPTAQVAAPPPVQTDTPSVRRPPVDPSAGAPPSQRPKRELPPYLRVVK